MATLKEKIGYALGDAAAGGITWKIMSIAFPLFFTNVFGLTFADAATLMLIARMFDVVTDPLMGSLADRTQSKWGTYRPWLIFGAIPFGLVFALLLYTPDFGLTGKRIWAYSLYLLMMALYTAVNVPYGSLLGVMTDDDNEKNQFSSFRMVGAYAMGFVTLLSFPYLQRLVGGTEQHQYAVLGAFFGVLAAAGTLACGFLTKERLKPVRAEKFSFETAALQLSEDKDTRLNNGLLFYSPHPRIPPTSRFEMKQLNQDIAKVVDTLKVGQISKAFVMTNEKGQQVCAIVRLKNRINAHPANTTDDFQTLREIVYQKRCEEKLEKWIREKVKTTYVRIKPEWASCNYRYEGWIK